MTDPNPDIAAWNLRSAPGEGWTDRTSHTFVWTDDRVRLTIDRVLPRDTQGMTLDALLDERESRFHAGPGDTTLVKRRLEIGQQEAGEVGVRVLFGDEVMIVRVLLVRDVGGAIYEGVMIGPGDLREAIDAAWASFRDSARIV